MPAAGADGSAGSAGRYGGGGASHEPDRSRVRSADAGVPTELSCTEPLRHRHPSGFYAPPTSVPTYPRGRSAVETWGGSQDSSSGKRKGSAGRSRSGRPRFDLPTASFLETYGPTDWICGSCNFVNFARNKRCKECDNGFPPSTSRKKPGPGDSMFVADSRGSPQG